MKNIVVLKNLPSNIVDEAIVVLKPNKKAKQIQHIEKLSKSEKNKKEDSGAYIVKEAQMVISNYLKYRFCRTPCKIYIWETVWLRAAISGCFCIRIVSKFASASKVDITRFT